MQCDTCPTECYLSNGHSANLRVRLTSSDWLKIGYMVQSQTIHRTVKGYSFVGLPLCEVSAATASCTQKSTFNQPHAQIRGMTAGHSMALHSVVKGTLEFVYHLQHPSAYNSQSGIICTMLRNTFWWHFLLMLVIHARCVLWDITNCARVDATSKSADQGHSEVKGQIGAFWCWKSFFFVCFFTINAIKCRLILISWQHLYIATTRK